MSLEERSERHSGHYLIPAGILIGLGIGLLIGHIASMLLIGLGCGFILAAFAGKKAAIPVSDSQPPESGSPGNTCCNTHGGFPCSCNGIKGSFVVIGIFFIILGVAITWASPDLWKYIAAGFLILFGIWFVYREYSRNR